MENVVTNSGLPDDNKNLNINNNSQPESYLNNKNKIVSVNEDINKQNINNLKKPNINKLVLTIVLFLLLISSFYFFYKNPNKYISLFKLDNIIQNNKKFDNSKKLSLKKFSTFEEFKSYMENSSQQMTGMFGMTEASRVSDANVPVASEGTTGATSKDLSTTSSNIYPDRSSETNIQVEGIDEPDIVKTDGKDIYISNINSYFLQRGGIEPVISTEDTEIAPAPVPDSKMISPPFINDLKTKIVGAFPVKSMIKKSEIDKSGEMFLDNGVLTIISGNTITAFDVKDSSSPKKIWDYEFDKNNILLSSRLKDGKIYLILRLSNYGNLCDIPITSDVTGIKISCLEIYHPDYLIPADSVFSVLKIDTKKGTLENKNSFVGSSGLSVFYMSPEYLYLTYTYYDDFVSLFYNFYESAGKGLLPTEVVAKIKNLTSLDISVQSKLTELSIILEKYKQSLNSDELLKIETETQNKLSEYLKKNIRSFEHSSVVKINSDDLNIMTTGSIPGKPLNQFSLDEYDGNLRIATTVGDGMFSDYSVNDVYVLNNNLDEIGKVTDMGQGEKIYSVRFIEDKGYVVTFKQTDPFYVLDLKNPNDPKKTGELKIPGYSSYLHKLDEDRILGVGMEGSKVKLSLFDVSDSSSPVEISKYLLDEYWTQVISTHHAFLQDEKNNIFFIPGGKGGYIISYKDSSLTLVKAISDYNIKRSIYINNYLYLVGDQKITVIDESDWKTIKSFSY